jgi:gamma-butyrobetaine dioxygenase
MAVAGDVGIQDAALPGTPDYDSYPVEHRPVRAEPIPLGVRVGWDDGLETRFHAVWLRENSPDPETTHPVTREQALMLADIPEGIAAETAAVEPGGVLAIRWNDGHASRYHPGWLRAHAVEAKSDHFALPRRRHWGAELGDRFPRFDGPAVLADETAAAPWLEALHAFGITLLERLPAEPDTIERVAERIGPIRPSNFGRIFEVRSKADADSNAYTAMALPLHTDLATREYKPGIQLLFCMRNDAAGGESLVADGLRIARELEREFPEEFRTATTLPLAFASRARDSDYRHAAPMIRLDAAGEPEEVRVSPWLRAPLVAPLEEVDRSYRALRRYLAISERPSNHVQLKLRAGDLLAFDNRRVLHGRLAYDPTSGERWLRGCYIDREELHSRLRMIARERRRQITATGSR